MSDIMLKGDSSINSNENENSVSNFPLDAPSTIFSPPPPPFPSLNDETPDYIYLTEALAPYKNYYINEWDEMFENVKSPMCDDISNYFFNPLEPLLPLDVIYPTILSPLTKTQTLLRNHHDTPILLNSPHNQDIVIPPPPSPHTPIVGGESDDQVLVVNSPPTLSSTTNHDAEIEKSTSLVLDTSLKSRKSNRPRKVQRTFNASYESDALTTPLEASQNTIVDPLACTQQKAMTSQDETMSQFSTLITKNEFLKSAIIKVDHNEDVAERIISFAKERGYVCICGTVGSLSHVELLQQQKIVTFEGNFNIISLKGSLIYPKNGDPMKGQLSITLAGNDGKVFGGVVHGRLIAQSTVQMNGFVSTSVKVNKTPNKQRNAQLRNEPNNHHCEDL